MNKLINILLVEDNEGDILLTMEALESGKLINNIDVTRNGELAISFLMNILENPEKELPELILLDINLPKKNGQDVLHFIKEHDSLKHIPVIMLTTSSNEKDVMASYRNHANCYITKPIDINSFMSIIAKLEEFWISIVKLPVHIK
ncbi:MAG: response regulator [Bacteroidota bacterium]